MNSSLKHGLHIPIVQSLGDLATDTSVWLSTLA